MGKLDGQEVITEGEAKRTAEVVRRVKLETCKSYCNNAYRTQKTECEITGTKYGSTDKTNKKLQSHHESPNPGIERANLTHSRPTGAHSRLLASSKPRGPQGESPYQEMDTRSQVSSGLSARNNFILQESPGARHLTPPINRGGIGFV
ncbi:hypothetical protein ElyMa_005871000 [Elysia marginata]|uniref:Apple domain-containing protein n=1 Tax=Elysia marginata TaxID=1093978 RepID=A0AAV4G1G7_9GAST|nr:hypothetical protein ElyMa_005871000 [Elysia marginata]